MRAILHIGMPKTGTSTLQQTLARHQQLLGRAGVLYPLPERGRPDHNVLATLLHPMESMPREFRSSGDGLEAIRQRGERFLHGLRKEVKRSRAEVAVLSGEYFYNLTEERVTALRELLGELFSHIEVVCYVRDPSAYYVSLMQQRVKASSLVRPPGLFHMRAEPCLSRHLAGFDGNVTVRSADRDALVGGCIVRDFLTSFVPGGDDLAGTVEVVDQNVSMSAEAMCILQKLRRLAFPDLEDVFRAESNRVAAVLRALDGSVPQTRARLRPELRAWLLHRHRRDLGFLRDRFGVTVVPDLPAEEPAGGEPPGSGSDDLLEIIDVDREQVERTLFVLVRELAAHPR